MNFDIIAAAALAQAFHLLPRWLPQGRWEGDEYIALNPTRADQHPGSFKINRSTGKAADFATGWKGKDLISVRAMLDGCSQSEAAKRLAQELGIEESPNLTKPHIEVWKPMLPIPANAPPPPERHPKHGAPSARWLYRDAEGNGLFWVCRFDKTDGSKEFAPLSYGTDGWRFKGLPAPRPLYNQHLLADYPDAVVIVFEGEKAADAASVLLPVPDYVVTCSPNGAKSAAKADWSPLQDRHVVIWPDHDAPGQAYAQEVEKQLGKSQVITLDPLVFGNHLKEGWDAADALAECRSAEEVQAVVRQLTNSTRKKEKSAPDSNSPYRILRGQRTRRDGVYFIDPNGDNDPLWVCSPLEIVALTHDGQGASWGYLLEWSDPDGRQHQRAMPAEMLAGQGDEYRRMLLDGGLQIAPGRKAKELLTTYIQTMRIDARARCTDKIGWHDGVFVLPSGTLGMNRERVLYQSTAIVRHAFMQCGTLEEWREHVSRPCSGNSRAVFAVSAAFAPTLLEVAGEESGGFHFRGESSSGKTKLLKISASVWGSPEYLQRWRATTNGVEGLAQLHNDCLLILDELAQVEPREAGKIAYMLGNGSGKTRASREGLARKAARWRLLYLSAGEIGLADHVRMGGEEVKAGQEIRLADIPADAGANKGVFENLHGVEDAASFARRFDEVTAKYYGTAGIAFLEHLIANIPTLPEWIAGQRRTFMQSIIPYAASGQVERVAARFALVAIAGELATHLGITGWSAGEAESAAKTCFNAWLEARGGAGNLEAQKLLADIRALLEAHSESRFTILGKDDGRPTINRMGFIREEGLERQYIILPQAFKRELCKGHDAVKATKVLMNLEILVPDYDGKPQRRESLPGMDRKRCYVLRGSKLWEAEHDA